MTEKEKRKLFINDPEKDIRLVRVTEPRREFEKTDYRRRLVEVEFHTGQVWYAKYDEVKVLNEKIAECFDHNIQFPDPEKYGHRKKDDKGMTDDQ